MIIFNVLEDLLLSLLFVLVFFLLLLRVNLSEFHSLHQCFCHQLNKKKSNKDYLLLHLSFCWIRTLISAHFHCFVTANTVLISLETLYLRSNTAQRTVTWAWRSDGWQLHRVCPRKSDILKHKEYFQVQHHSNTSASAYLFCPHMTQCL